jgi:beta-barrel assembly-enhancing protease
MFKKMLITKTVAALGLLFGLAAPVLAQDYDDYKVRESKGNLPADFTTKSSSKYKAAVAEIGKKEKRSAKKLKKQFFLESSFSIDQLLHSGTVLYDPEFSEYLHSVAAKVLGDDKQIIDKTRFYVVRSPAVNAFATNEGLVFVCMGLLAQLENEAQLGFVLSHEIIHVREKHSVNMYVKVDDIKKGMNSDRILSRSAFERQLLEKSKFSKAIELEADTKGFNDYYAKSGYSIAAIERAYDVMRFAELPFDEQKFDKTFWEDANYVFPEKFFLKEVKKIVGTAEDEDDETATHPNISKRRENMAQLIADKKAQGGKEFLISEAIFTKWQKVSRFELPQLYLHNNYFQEAIYTSYLLLKDDPNSLYLKKSMAKALYGIAKFRNSDDDTVEAEEVDFEKQEGESQQVMHLFHKMENLDVTVLATRYLWQLRKQYPKDKEIDWLARDIVADLVRYNSSKLSSFEHSLAAKNEPVKVETPPAETEGSSQTVKVTQKKKSKYDKIKEAEKTVVKNDSTSNNKSYLRFALVDCFADTAFAGAIAEGKRIKENIEKYKEEGGREKFIAEREKEQKNGARIGADKIVVVNPYYLSIDARKQNAIQYIETEENAARFRAAILDNAQAVGLATEILSPSDFTATDTEKYNDMTVLNEWVSEQVDYGTMDFTGYRADRLDAIAKKYDTRYFVWTGVVGLRKKKNAGALIGGAVLATAFILPLPFWAYYAIKPEYETLFYTIVYDTETRTSRRLKYEYMKVNDKKHILDMHLYDAFLQLKLKKKTVSSK